MSEDGKVFCKTCYHYYYEKARDKCGNDKLDFTDMNWYGKFRDPKILNVNNDCKGFLMGGWR
jgi:hypothetical protein